MAGNFFTEAGNILFGETEKLTPRDIRSPEQQQMFGDLTLAAGGAATNYLQTAGDPFAQSLVDPTPLTSLQQSIMGGIPGALGSPFSESDLFRQSSDVIRSELGGFDPAEDFRYKALQKSLGLELQRAKDRIAARSSAGNEFFGGGRMDQERELEETAQVERSRLLGDLFTESGRRQVAAVPAGVEMAMLEQNAPGDWIAQALGLAGIPWQVDENQRAARYNEQLRQRGELQGTVPTALQTSMYSPPLAYPVYSSTPGLLGGPSGVGYQPGGGVNRNVQYAQAGLGAIGGAAGGGGLSGAAAGALGSGGTGGGMTTAQMTQLIQQLLGGG